MLVRMATKLGVSHVDFASSAEDAQSPASTASVRLVALAGAIAAGLIELLRANNLVAAVALAAILGTSDRESQRLAAVDALLVGHGTDIGANLAVENAVLSILEAAGVLEAANFLGDGSRGGGRRLAGGNSDGLVDGVSLGRSACVGGLIGRLRKSGLSVLSLSLRSARRLSGGRSIGGLGRGSSVGRLRLVTTSWASGLGTRLLCGLSRLATRLRATVAPAGEQVLSRKGAQESRNLLGDRRVNRALFVVDTVEETLALVHTLGTSIAGVDDVLEKLSVPASQEISVQRVSSRVTVGKDKRLSALAFLPAALELGGVPVEFVEEVRRMDPSLGAVLLSVVLCGESHVILVVLQTSLGVVARWEVNVSSEGRGVAVAGDVGETNTFTLVDGILHASHHAVGVGRPRGRVEVVLVTRACPLDGLDRALRRIEVGLGTTGRRSSLGGITRENLEANGESFDLVVGGFKAGLVRIAI